MSKDSSDDLNFSKSLGLQRKIDEFSIKEQIGRGQYGSVYRCIEKNNGKEFALKLIEPANDDVESYKFFTREVMIQSQVNHPALIPLHCFGENCAIDLGEFSYIMSPLMKNGSLDKFISIERIRELSTTTKMIIIYGTASGMNFLHKSRVIHRDLKPANILLDENFRPFISDFGFSKYTPNGSKTTFSIRPGTPLYLAPELLEDDEENLSSKVDVYAFGIIVFNILTGLQFSDITNQYKLAQYVQSGKRPNIPEGVDEKYKQLIESCWAQSPIDRPSFDEIIEFLDNEENWLSDTIKQSFEKYRQYVNSVDDDVAIENSDAGEDEPPESITRTAPVPNFNLSFRGFRPFSLCKSQNSSKFICFHFQFNGEEMYINLSKNITVFDTRIVLAIEKNIPPSYLKLTFNETDCNEKYKLSSYTDPSGTPIIIKLVKDLSTLPTDEDEVEEIVEEEVHLQVNVKTTKLILKEINSMAGLEPLDVFHNFFVCGKSMALFKQCNSMCRV